MPRSAQVRTLSQSAHLRTTLLRSGAPERRPSATARCHANPSAVCLAEFIKAGPFCYADGPQLQADTMQAIHALADYLQKGAQLDIEDDGSGTPDHRETYYVLFPNHARVGARVVSVAGDEATIEVGLRQWKIRRARPEDRLRDSGLTRRTSWLVVAPI
jgi:hypothetical protein